MGHFHWTKRTKETTKATKFHQGFQFHGFPLCAFVTFVVELGNLTHYPSRS
jgi:hypothetical protein